jgi:hypothetical protein
MVWRLKWVQTGNLWDFGLHLVEKVLIISHLTQDLKDKIKQYLDIKIQSKAYFGSMIML